MLTKLGGGNTITHRWPLNIENVHEIEAEMWDLEAGDFVGLWDLGAPAAGYCWVLSSITVSVDFQPVVPAILSVDADSGADVYWVAYIGHLPPPIVVANTVGPYKFEFSPAIKFPVNQDIAINWIGGDAAITFFITWEVWQELESVSP